MPQVASSRALFLPPAFLVLCLLCWGPPGPLPRRGVCPQRPWHCAVRGPLPRKNRRLFASRPRCRSALFRGPYPAGPVRVTLLSPFRILAFFTRSLRSGAGTPTPLFPSLSPARRFLPPEGSVVAPSGSLRRSSLLPGPVARLPGFRSPPAICVPGPLPLGRAGGAPPRVQTTLSPVRSGGDPYPAALALSVPLATLAWLFEPLQKNQLASPNQKAIHWSVGRSVGEHMRSLKPVSPFGVLLQGVVTANISRPKILRSVFIPPKFASANAQ